MPPDRITKLPKPVTTLLTTAHHFSTFESTIATTLTLLHRTATTTRLTIHPQALRFTINTDTIPDLSTLLPLSSISSLQLTTPSQQTLLHNSKQLSATPARNDDTLLEVWQLFNNLPIRRRHESLREPSSIVSATREEVVRIALRYPGKALYLVAEDTPIYTFSGSLTTDALQVAFGLDITWERVFTNVHGTSIHGFVGRDGVGSSRYQICTREGVVDDSLCEVVKTVWKGLPRRHGRCAAFVINIRGEGNVHGILKRSVKAALGVVDSAPKQEVITLRRVKKRVATARFSDTLIRRSKRPLSEGHLSLSSARLSVPVSCRPATSVEDAYRRMIPSWKNPCLPSRAKSALSGIYDKRSASISRERLTGMRVVGQVDKKFIIIADEQGLYAVDQHAASERYLYERLLKRCMKECRPRKLANPRVVNVSCILRPLAARALVEAEKWGWRVGDGASLCNMRNDEAINDGLVVTHVAELPTVGVVMEPESLVEWFEECFEGGKQVPRVVGKIVANKACHSAVRFGDRLSKEMCSSIVTSLVECDMPFVCAHGRPNIVPIVTFQEC